MLNLLALDYGNIAMTVFGIGGLIVVHEFGHFIVGRLCGVKAEAFSVGFGPVIAKWQPGETEYRLSAVPLGGYVKFLGENPDERGERDPRSFFAATYPRKVAIMLAGVTMNVLAAFVLFVMAFSSGVEVIPPVAGPPQRGSPAEKAGILAGDRIVEIDGHRILDFEDIIQEVAFAEEVSVVVERGGARMAPITVPTRASEEGIRQLGIEFPTEDGPTLIAVEGSAAHKAGLRPGDEVVAVNGVAAATVDAALALHVVSDTATTWTIRRDGKPVDVIVPRDVWIVGISQDPESAKGSVPGIPVTVPRSDAGQQSAAADAGLPESCRIIAADGAAIAAFDDLRAAANRAGTEGREMVLRWTPADGGEPRETSLRPRRATKLVEFGIAKPRSIEMVRETNVVAALGLGIDRTHRWVLRIFDVLRSMVTGRVSAKHLQGPIGIAQMSYSQAGVGWAKFFLFLGMISMNLAVLNVLPIPLLDGGQLAIITAEKVRGKPLPERVLEGIQWSGLLLLLSFMVYVIVNDIRRL